MSKKDPTIIPLGNKVLVEPIQEEKTDSGIILPDTVEKDAPEQGRVVAVGPGKKDEIMTVKKGDKVVFSKYGHDEINVAGKEYYILEEDKILAVIK